MLANPDIQPSASINRWIVAILMYHFELVHVKGVFHGPDGLSRRPKQPNDPEADEDENDRYEDWIDRLNGFMHLIQPIRPYHDPPANVLLVLENTIPLADTLDVTDKADKIQFLTEDEPRQLNANDTDLTYDEVPRTEAAIAGDDRVEQVRKFLDDLKRPAEMTDADYKKFIKYATNFFLDADHLYRRDASGAHKLVDRQSSRIGILRALHDDLGHKGIYATCAAVLE
ncbi:hypothetical protein H0H93_016410 [Arthromyces matolae]|nr:hypothetical protein H0H93_016410 [Arthromyces matolae]